MIDNANITGPAAAFVAGIITSLHCVGMCGPLACAACTSKCGRESNAAAGIYHLTRISAYVVLGAAAGFLGQRISEPLLDGATRGMTWLFVLFFLAVATGLDKRLKLPAPGAWFAHLFCRTEEAGLYAKAATLGTLTPLLPCAPLYLVVAAAALAGSALSGAIVMAAFGFGTAPLFFAVQNRLAAIERSWSPRAMDCVRRVLAVASIALLLVRGTYAPQSGCPLCH
jgi:sulfite exporter TauE/SafE